MSSKTTYEHIVAAADKLFYQQGYDHTSFSDIADAVQISRGNFYYHFKTKDEILNAVIALRIQNTQKMLRQWESEESTPAGRIRRYIHILLTNWPKISCFGCPVGTLCTELAKLDHGSQKEARKVFGLFRRWLRRQFILLGHKKDADTLAMHVLAWSQGVATLASTFRDRKFVSNEVKQMCEWLNFYTNNRSE